MRVSQELKFLVESRHFDITRVIKAKNRKQAWARFSALHSGKTAKEDWQISRVR